MSRGASVWTFVFTADTDSLAQQPPLERLRKEETNLKGDQAKFLNWIKIHEEKSKKMEDGNGKLREALRMEGEFWVRV